MVPAVGAPAAANSLIELRLPCSILVLYFRARNALRLTNFWKAKEMRGHLSVSLLLVAWPLAVIIVLCSTTEPGSAPSVRGRPWGSILVGPLWVITTIACGVGVFWCCGFNPIRLVATRLK